VSSNQREMFLKVLVGFGLLAYKKERDLKTIKTRRELTVSEVEQLEYAIKATDYAERRRSEFVSHGVICGGQAFDRLPWWPTQREGANMTLKMMSHAARAKLDLDRLDPARIDLSKINFAKKRMRELNPDDYFN
jgi:hypothetical protein